MKDSKKKPKPGGSRDERHVPQKADDEDARFAHIRQDPIFRRVPKDKKRVNIDSRFGAMFHDDKFKLKYKVDKRGKPINQTTDENLKRYYNLVEDEEETSGQSGEDREVKGEVGEDDTSSTTAGTDAVKTSEISKEEEPVGLSEKTKKKLQDLTVDYARGEGILNSDSEDESDDSSTSEDSTSSEEEDEGIEDMTHAWGEIDRDAERTEEVTHRLALCNMDWDRIKSEDLMILFNSFLPPGGTLKYVTIYPSEYGKKRLEEEELYGPRELREKENPGEGLEHADLEDDSNSSEDQSDEEGEDEMSTGFVPEEGEEGNSFHMERLRKYQLNRLKYYYAVMEFDSPETANTIYKECDGLEFESSATKIDLRFIPNDLTFEEEPRDKCDKIPPAEKYIPKFFTTTALQQMKVDLTWDETDPQRELLTKRVHDPKEKVDDEDLRAYLASSSDDDDNTEGGIKIKQEDGEAENSDEDTKSNIDSISKYRELLESIQGEETKKKDKDVEMEITWGVGLKKTTENLVKKKLGEERAKKMTPWEEMLAKKHEKKKMKKKQGKDHGHDEDPDRSSEDNDEQAREDADSDDGGDHEEDLEDNQLFSDDDVDVDLNDPFFQEELQTSTGKSKKSKSKRTPKTEDTASKKQKEEDAAALELLLMDDDSNEKKSHFSLKKILEAEQNEAGGKKSNKKKKRNKKKNSDEGQTVATATNTDNFQIDLEDDRFSALYTSHKFNVDPSDPNFKNTKAMSAIITEKQKRRHTAPMKPDVDDKSGNAVVGLKEGGGVETEPPMKISRKSELASLVKSIKRNTENLKQKKSFGINQRKTH